MFRPCIVIPYYRHERAIGALIERLRGFGLPCFLVDDGSGGAAAAVVRELAAREAGWLRLQVLPRNQGKGVAVMSGCAAAAAEGYSHALQIDADGQHATADVPRLLALARAAPAAVVTGVPVYDASAPRVRIYGRYLTHALVWLHTLSFEIRDSMCGFRVYPLAPLLALERAGGLGRRMDFDTDVLVRLHWTGVRVISMPTRVTYPADGVSHFDYLADNARMARLHLRLFFGMLARLPRWGWRRLRGLPARSAVA
ncbi:MAG: glycosyltransferase family 2 protein [Nevskia sp.]|nr:glycosyltransferase family 2 protein [Nevskia sp.]